MGEVGEAAGSRCRRPLKVARNNNVHHRVSAQGGEANAHDLM